MAAVVFEEFLLELAVVEPAGQCSVRHHDAHANRFVTIARPRYPQNLVHWLLDATALDQQFAFQCFLGFLQGFVLEAQRDRVPVRQTSHLLLTMIEKKSARFLHQSRQVSGKYRHR